MQTRGNDQLNPRFLHFPELPFRYTLLQGQEVLRANPVGFVNDLPPPMLAGCLCRQHSQPYRWKGGILVSRLGREHEVRTLAVFDDGFVLEVDHAPQPFLQKDVASVKFQGIPGPRFAALQNGLSEADEALNAGESLPIRGE